MTGYRFSFCGTELIARSSGALFWPARSLLCVSDLHFGKAQRSAKQGGATLPPYEVRDTLSRLDADIAHLDPSRVICLGDSFDAIDTQNDLDTPARDWILRLQAGREWIWIEGNHDPGPVDLGGSHVKEWQSDPLTFRHIAQGLGKDQTTGEITGHYHPKITVKIKSRPITRRCFVVDAQRLILPAYGTYTGGLSVYSPAVQSLLNAPAFCILTGSKALPVPLSVAQS